MGIAPSSYSNSACDTDMKSDRVPGEERVLLGIPYDMICPLLM